MRMRVSRVLSCLLGAFVVAIVLSALCATPARGAVNAATSLVAVRVEKPPPLDPALTDPIWTTAVHNDGFVSVTTHAPSRQPTSFAVLYDTTNLYVAIHCDQKGIPISATQGAHDVGFGLDDFVGVGIDPSANGSQVYFFMTTPRGTRYEQSTESSHYAPPWTAVAKTTPFGWNAILVVPFKIMRVPSRSVQRWRFDVIRRIAAADENESWAFDPLMNDGGGGVSSFPAATDARYWPTLTDLNLASARRAVRFEGYALANAGADRRQFVRPDGSFAESGVRRFGADVTYPITGTVSLVGAFAPDFSNVEIDQQTIAPQEFRRSFTEYRPFFAQGASFLLPISLPTINAPPNRYFYSPSIGAFDRGLKIEGTFGLQSLGLLEAKGAGFDDIVFGFKHVLPDRSFGYSIDGALAHHQLGNATIDQRAGDDGVVEAQIRGQDNHTGFIYALDYAGEQGTFVKQNGLAHKSEDLIDVHKPNYEFFLGYRDIGPEYGPVDGYTGVPDERGLQSFLDVNGTLAKYGPVKRIDATITVDRFVDRSSAAHQSDASVTLDIELKNGFHLSGGPSTSALRTYNGNLVGYPNYANGLTQSYNAHSLAIGYRDGTSAPIDVAYSWGPFTSFYLQQVSASTSRPIGPRFSILAELDGTREHYLSGGADGQWLRRVGIGETLGKRGNISLSLRTISGNGGFASPGTNLAASFHYRFASGSELFFNYGTPAATSTLQRFILKYVLRTGAGAGT